MKSTPTSDMVTKVLGELFGTTILVFLGCLGCIGSDAGLFKIALNFGLTVMTVVHCFGFVSGAHLSPAITLAAWIMDILAARLALAYVCAQLLGCYLGYALLMYLIPTTFIPLGDGSGFCLTMPHSDFSYMQATAIEFVITAALVLFACSIWDPRNAKDGETAPIRFCLAIVALALSAVSCIIKYKFFYFFITF